MANLPETPIYDAGVYQKETTDIALGGPDGKANAGARNLANRTAYLKQHLDSLETIVPQAEAEAGTATTVRAWTALRVRQAINVAVAAVVNSAPTVLDTLSELAAALGNDANFAATITAALSAKAPLAGLSTQQFSAANASGIHHAVTLGQTLGNFGPSGYLQFPFWDGGQLRMGIFQWTFAVCTTGGVAQGITLPIAYPNAISIVYGCATGVNQYAYADRWAASLTAVQGTNNQTGGGIAVFAIGY